jgi:hypothetical protein
MAGLPRRNANRQRGGSNADEDAIPDLGILKTLNTMGKMATNFATSLASGTTTGARPQTTTHQGRTTGGTREYETETNPLVANREVRAPSFQAG